MMVTRAIIITNDKAHDNNKNNNDNNNWLSIKNYY